MGIDIDSTTRLCMQNASDPMVIFSYPDIELVEANIAFNKFISEICKPIDECRLKVFLQKYISPQIINYMMTENRKQLTITIEKQNYEVVLCRLKNHKQPTCLLTVLHSKHVQFIESENDTFFENYINSLNKENETLDLFFKHAVDGFFFMMIDEPVEWNENTDKAKLIDYIFEHQRITKANSAMLKQYGAAENELLGLTPKDFYVDNEEGKRIWTAFFDNGKKSFVTHEKKFDGTPMWIEGTYKCFYNQEGKITGHFGIQREITERIENEEKLKEQKKLLEEQNKKIRLQKDEIETQHTELLAQHEAITDMNLSLEQMNIETLRANELLKMSEEKFRIFFNCSVDSIFILDKQGEIMEMNRSALDLLNINPEDISTLKAVDIRLFDNNKNKILKLIENKHIHTFTTYLKTNQNKFVPYEIICNLTVFDDKEIILATARDISERLDAENKIKESEQILKTIFETTTTGYMLLDLNKKLLTFNKVAVHYVSLIYGKTIKNDINILDIFSKAGAKEFNAYFNEVLKGRTVSLRKDKKDRHFDIKLQPAYRDNDIIFAVTFSAVDITDTIIYQEKIKRSERLYRLLSENSGDLICLHNANGKFTYVSQSVKKLLGYNTDELIGKYPNEFVHNDDLQKVNNFIPKDLENEINIEYRAKSKHGEYYWLSTNATLHKSDNTGELFIQSSTRDISKWKVYEAVLRREKEKALKASKVKDEFLSVISHEIRTPMHAIDGLTQLLLKDNPREEQKKNLQTLEYTIKNMMYLINDILDYSKIQSGKLSLEETTFSFPKIVQNIEQVYKYQAKTKGIEFITDVDSQIPQNLIGDPVRISQIINNLLNNAIKFTHNGNVKLVVKLYNMTDNRNCTLYVEVADTGIGIPQNMQTKIFKRFTQASSDITRKYGGTGLGLAITKQLLELHKSKINLISKVNFGTKVFFLLDLKIGEQTSVGEEADTDKNIKALKDKRFLIVEDNEINRTIIEQFVKEWGVWYEFAFNGAEGIERIEKNDYDIVLMDIQMPVMSGIEATKKIRNSNNEKIRNIPIIALTADITSETKYQIDNSGFNDYISKPFAPENLFNIIAGILGIQKMESKVKTHKVQEVNENIIDFNMLLEICNFDANSTARLIDSTKASFNEFRNEYKNAMSRRDFEQLRGAHHQVKPGIALINYKNLAQTIQNGRMLLQNNAEQKELNQNAQKVYDLCTMLFDVLDKNYLDIFGDLPK